MAYEARRGTTDEDFERARADANNAKNIRNAADLAIKSGNPYGVVVGGAIKGVDAFTGNALSNTAGKFATNVGGASPIGKKFQNASNKLAESGLSDKAGQAASLYNGAKGKTTDNIQNQVKNNENSGGEKEKVSLPSSGDSNTSSSKKDSSLDNDKDDKSKDDEQKSEGTGVGRFFANPVVKVALILFLPFILFILFFVIIFAGISNFIGEFEDAVGISDVTGGKTGDVSFSAGTKDQQDFYNRVEAIKLKYQTQGKYVDALKVVAVFHILERNGANVDYKKMSDARIQEIMDSMLSDNIYNEEVFKNNLVSSLIPKYLPNSSQKARENMVEEVFDYIDDYYEIIGENPSDYSCTNGSCTYDIKGFYISGRGNVSKNLKISDLYVRLMQCGVADGHNYGGTFGQPLAGEELVPFEKYILGVAYQEIGPDAPAEAIKAQMVAARSYILTRHVDIGGWRTLQEENGKWILQAASCTQDQVYCDPDQGCSSNDGQWGQVHSGLNYNRGFSRGVMAQDSPLRTYASQTQGEVLVNQQGYVVYSGYRQTEQDKFTALAKQGLNYKQILMQVYNQGNRNYGASGLAKASCNGGKSNCVSSSEYANWRQYSEPWASVKMGSSGKTIKSIGCLATSVAILVKKSGVPTNIDNFNPGTFVEKLSQNGGFDSQGCLQWYAVTKVIPNFQYQGKITLMGLTREQKLNKIKEIANTPGLYAAIEVKGNQGEHWVALDSVNGNSIRMIDPGTNNTDMWSTYNWINTSQISYYKVS